MDITTDRNRKGTIMFDMSKLGDMAGMAKQARKMQSAQEKAQREQTDLLRKISKQLDTVIKQLEKR
jgi:hypothetical protein